MRWIVEIKSKFTPFWYAGSSHRTGWIKSTELVRRSCSQLRADTDDEKMNKAVTHTRLAHTASSTGEGSLLCCRVHATDPCRDPSLPAYPYGSSHQNTQCLQNTTSVPPNLSGASFSMMLGCSEGHMHGYASQQNNTYISSPQINN